MDVSTPRLKKLASAPRSHYNTSMKTLVFFFALASIASARLGETVEQCRARYGHEKEANQNTLAFLKNGMIVGIEFHNFRAAKIVFTHENDATPLLTMPEVRALLDANRGPSTWHDNLATALPFTWQTLDGKRTASFSGNTLVLTDESITLPTPDEIKKDVDKLKGF